MMPYDVTAERPTALGVMVVTNCPERLVSSKADREHVHRLTGKYFNKIYGI